ncbi:MAG: WD40 repeat domain-containing protein [Gammaproteobacteria bacterium]|jgi:WD40 repeat protein|nr:WD40 repeat domain-containing protein [Gammaproteobacteria bacterium]MBT7369326.1 WD40 repeat domain-containing protein [Gammaproteobacteria bacterium]
MKGLLRLVMAICRYFPLLILIVGCDDWGSEKITVEPEALVDKARVDKARVDKTRVDERSPELTRVRLAVENYNLKRQQPVSRLLVSSDILDIALSGESLLVASHGFIDEYDLSNLERIRRLTFKPITNHYGDLRDPRVYSVDFSPGGNEIAFVLETADGNTEVGVISDGQKTRLISGESKLALRKIRYIDATKLLLATLESEVLLYDRSAGGQVYKRQQSLSSFSDLAMDAGRAVIADESGTVPVFDPNSGETLFVIRGGNFDRIYDIDIRGSTILTGGKDRSASVYTLDRNAVRKFDAGHQIYAVALNQKADRAAFPLFNNAEAIVMNLDGEKITHSLDGAGKSLNMLTFVSDKRVLGATYNEILIWSLE